MSHSSTEEIIADTTSACMMKVVRLVKTFQAFNDPEGSISRTVLYPSNTTIDWISTPRVHMPMLVEIFLHLLIVLRTRLTECISLNRMRDGAIIV
jgi:hypothetical protein